ncbi:hypothetical protein [Oceanobacillus caeni]|uniref:hypothetical protein n=1 Tax=Oceanobacillus caeni TaxID=405946 RepID=UPI000B16022A
MNALVALMKIFTVGRVIGSPDGKDFYAFLTAKYFCKTKNISTDERKDADNSR